MVNNEEIQQRIINALQAKLGQFEAKCPMCGSIAWDVGTRYTVLPLSAHPTQAIPGGACLPIIPISCKNCGNTQLINLITLGFEVNELDSLSFGNE